MVEGRVKTPGFDAKAAATHRRIKVEIRSGRQNALPLETRAAHDMHAVLERGRVVEVGGLGGREFLPEDADGGGRIGGREHQPFGHEEGSGADQLTIVVPGRHLE